MCAMPDETEVRPGDAPAPEAAGDERPVPSDDDAEARQVWDPATKQWIDPHLIPPEAPPKKTSKPVPPRPDEVAYVPAAAPGAVGPAVLLAAVVGAVLAVVVMLFFPGRSNRAGTTSATPVPPASAGSDPVQLSEAVRPSVVGVRVGDRTASGVIMDTQGVVITTSDVVGDEDSATVTYASGRTSDATVEGVDRRSGIAILLTERTGGPAIVRGTAEFLRTGEPLVVVAAPRDTYTVVDVGLVLSPGRPVGEGDGARLDLVRLGAADGAEGGGAVVGVAGTVVGLTTDVPAESGVASFLPMEAVVAVANQLLDEDGGGEAAHPWIGLATSLASDDPRVPSDAEGLLVTEVVEASPGARAALRRGDLIVEIDGDPVEGSLTLLARLLGHEVGDEMSLGVMRGERAFDVKVRVVERGASDETAEV